MSDLDLFNALKKDDNASFETLFRKYFKSLTVFANKLLHDLDESQDLVQEVFVKLYENRNTLEVHTSVKALLYQSVRNKSLDRIRSKNTKSGHHEQILALSSDDHIDDSDSILQVELEEKIYSAISNLPDQCQLIFKMSRLEGKRNQEIAEELNISKRTVETQISNALKKLRVEIFQYLKGLIFIVLHFFS